MISPTVGLIAQVTSTLLALLALFIGLRNESRNQKRFDEQLDQSKKIAAAGARPLLMIGREGYKNEKAVTVENRGPGVAIVTSVLFKRKNRHASDISDLVDVPPKPEILWDEINPYESFPYYLAGQSAEDMIRISADSIIEAGLSPKAATVLLENIEAQLDEIRVVIKYEDVFSHHLTAEG